MPIMNWPDYEEILDYWMKRGGIRRRGSADFWWCKWAFESGRTRDEVKEKLLEVSEKARSEWDRGNRGYVEQTLDDALGENQLF